jgi:subtilisin family serine protease
MRVRPNFAPAFLCAVALSLLLPPPASAQMKLPIDTMDRGLQAAESGAELPPANRPLPRIRSVNDRLLDRVQADAAPAPFVAPDEFGVVIEYEGGRVALEAAGVRVVSQVGDIYTARMRKDEIANLRGVRGLKSARLARYTRPNLNVSRVDVNAVAENAGAGIPPVYSGRAGRGMIIGDVDSGIDWTRSDFADSLGKTRILYIWDQNDAVGPAPSGFGYGSEFTKSQIDNTPGSVRQQDTDGHGTAVAGVLIGNGSMTGCSQPAYRYVGIAPLANFIEVKTDFSDAGIIDGVNYIFTKAAALGKDAVVNLSLGSQFGPHDGSDTFPAAISALTGPGRIVVASAGNDQEDKVHGKLTTTSTVVGTDRFTFQVPSYTANAGTFNDYVLITGWYDPAASYTIRVKGPNAADTLSCGFGQSRDRSFAAPGGKVFIANQHGLFGYGGTSKGRQFEVEIYDSVSTNRPRIGTWEIDVVSNGAGNIGKRVDMWVYAAQVGATGALVPVVVGLDNTTMVGSPADGDSVFAVAAHATKASWASCLQGGTCAYTVPPTLNAIASFSCVGPRRDGVLKPEISAPGFGVATTHSNQAGAIGTCGDVDDGVHEVEAGTSFSAPHVAAAASLFLSAYPGSSPSRVKQAFQAHARTDAFTGAVPNPTWGYGKLDIYSTFDHQGPTVALTAPAGGETWNEGSIHNVTWNASDFSGVASVDLALSTDGGGIYGTPIATAIPNTGSYAWTVPAGATTTARVRVTAKDTWGNLASAFSAANFTIQAVDNVNPSITLTSPGTVEAGTSANVAFAANDNVGVTGVDLEYSSDNGTNWAPLATGLTSSPYLWSVPGVVVAQARLRATARDAANNSAQDVTGAFQIVDTTPPLMVLAAPNGGESWTVGDTRLIDWTASDLVGVDSVRVEVSLHGAGGPWSPVATVAPDTSGYSWVVPASPTDSALVRVTAYDGASHSTVDLSDALFAIVSPVGVPGGGDLAFALLAPMPNPGVGTTTLRFRLPSPADATLEIFKPGGQRVWTSGTTSYAAGESAVRWSGRDAAGAHAPAGLYFVRLTTQFGTKNAKMIRL